MDFDEEGHVVGIEEKPSQPRSQYAITGLYFYDNRVLEIAAGLHASARGELEISDVNSAYLSTGELHVEILGRGVAWLDTGTPEALLQAQNFVETMQERQGLQVACLEEIALGKGWLTAADLAAAGREMGHSAYGAYLCRLAEESGA